MEKLSISVENKNTHIGINSTSEAARFQRVATRYHIREKALNVSIVIYNKLLRNKQVLIKVVVPWFHRLLCQRKILS